MIIFTLKRLPGLCCALFIVFLTTVSEIARRIALPSQLRPQIAEIRHNHVEDRLTRNLLLALLISLLDRLPGNALNLHAINLSISKPHFHKCREERGSVRYATLRDAIAI